MELESVSTAVTPQFLLMNVTSVLSHKQDLSIRMFSGFRSLLYLLLEM